MSMHESLGNTPDSGLEAQLERLAKHLIDPQLDIDPGLGEALQTIHFLIANTDKTTPTIVQYPEL